MPRTIIHVDLDAFYCSIEEQRNPELKGTAFAVGGQPQQRGVIASCSYAARAMGVRSAMATSRALSCCPQLTVVPTRHSIYRSVSAQVMELLRSITPLTQQLSIDEAFMDVSSLVPEGPLSAVPLARRLQSALANETGLSCSIGIATNMMVAKIATDFGKGRVATINTPRAIWAVPEGEEAAFLAPLPASALWGVGPKTAADLASQGIRTIGDIAQCPVPELMQRFGRHGYELARHCRGIDSREIVTARDAKSVSSECTFPRDLRQWEQLLAVLREQAQSVSRQLRAHALKGLTVKLKLRWSDFSTVTRQITLPRLTDDAAVVEKTSTDLLRQLWQRPRPVRLLGVGVSRLSRQQQLSLWEETDQPPLAATSNPEVPS